MHQEAQLWMGLSIRTEEALLEVNIGPRRWRGGSALLAGLLLRLLLLLRGRRRRVRGLAGCNGLAVDEGQVGCSLLTRLPILGLPRSIRRSRACERLHGITAAVSPPCRIAHLHIGQQAGIGLLRHLRHLLHRHEGLGPESFDNLGLLCTIAISITIHIAVAVQHVVSVGRRELVHRVTGHIVDADSMHRIAHRRSTPGSALLLVLGVGEGIEHGQRGGQHLQANEQILQVGTVLCLLYHVCPHQNGNQNALPEGEEDNRLDQQELKHGIEGRQQRVCSLVEHKQRKQCHAVRDVVHYRDVQVPVLRAPVARSVVPGGKQDHGSNAEDWHQQHKLQRSLLALLHKVPVHHLGRQAAGAGHPGRLQNKAVHLDLHFPRTAHITQAQIQKRIDHECLVDDANCVEVDRLMRQHQRQKRADSVDRNHEYDAHNVALKHRRAVMLQVVHNLPCC
mmetsp:Transcript_2363/g.7134  ORF Transcript_2363/g.7134 Transcript_2363/m.7134 type:complete len:450 (+) Transcript_2363:301-1650(+)